MFTRAFRLGVVVFISQSLIYLPLVNADQLSLPSGDLVAPEVTHEPISEKFAAGTSHQIKATVTDNVGVKSVTLFYRMVGVKEYKRINMAPIENSDVYIARLGDVDVVEPGIEYYIQATDVAGNTLLHGYSFSPLVVSVVPALMLEPSSPNTVARPVGIIAQQQDGLMKKNTKKWLWVGLGVLAVGAVVAANANANDDPGGAPKSGAIEIKGPSP